MGNIYHFSKGQTFQSTYSANIFKTLLVLFALLLGNNLLTAQCGNLYIAGVVDGTLTGGIPKGVQFCASGDIADLSIYGFGSANNGGGSDGEEFTFPADALSSGECVWVASEASSFMTFFGCAADYTDNAANINGDDAIELFCSGIVEDLFGDINVDGNGECWEYLDGWATNNQMMPNFGAFDCMDWTFSGVDGLEGGTNNATANIPYPNPCPVASSCTITNVTVQTNGTCSGDDATYTVCADVAGGSGDYDLVDTDNGNAVIASLSSPDGMLCFTVTVTGPTSAATLNLDVVDANDATCIGGAPVAVDIPDCGCMISNFIITSAPMCQGNDVVFSVCADVTNGSGFYSVVDDGGNTIGGPGIGTDGTICIDNIIITGPTTAMTFDIIFQDSNNSTCMSAPVPLTIPTCNVSAGCSITNVNVDSDGTCNGDDAQYTICFTVANGSNQYNLIDVDNGNAVLDFINGAGTDGTFCLTTTVTGPTASTTLNVDMVDANDATCIGGTPVAVTIPECPTCSISNVVVEMDGECDGDNATYQVCVDVANGSGDYNLIDTGNGNAVLASLTGQADGNICFDVTISGPTAPDVINIDVVDANDASCIGGMPMPVNIPECMMAACDIFNVLTSTSCNADGTYCVDVEFDAIDPGASGYNIVINGVPFGPFSYDPGMIQGQTMLCDASFIGDGQMGIMVSVADIESATGGGGSSGGTPIISELHYDNAGGDEGEAIEITAPAGTDLMGYSLVLYNGSNGLMYNTIALSGIVADAGAGCGAISFDATGIQNGNDAIALVDPAGTVLEFISYEGPFAAGDGPASGMTAVDIGVAESSATPIGESLQLTDAGWIGPIANTMDAVNASLSCPTGGSGGSAMCMGMGSFDEDICVMPAVGITIDDNDNGDDTQMIPQGGAAAFSITFTNPGTESLCNLAVTNTASDPTLDGSNCEPNLAALIMAQGDGDAELDPGETVTYTCMITGVMNDFTNTVEITGEGCITGITVGVTSTDDSAVIVIPPCDITNLVATPTCNVDVLDYCVEIDFDVANGGASGMYNVNIGMTTYGPFNYTDLPETICDPANLIGNAMDVMVTVTDVDNMGMMGSMNGVFISEIHYDNFGTDENEGLEISAPAGTDLAGYSIILYNGNGGVVYSTIPLSGIVGDDGAGCGALSFESASGIQNGPDGIALVDPSGMVLEFISYEGAFMATDGPLAGMTSTDIGVSEPGEIGESLQLTDAGWVGPTGVLATLGVFNSGLTSCGSSGGGSGMLCAASTTITEPTCVVPVCDISNVMVNTQCGFSGNYDIEVCFDYVDPISTIGININNKPITNGLAYPSTSGGCIFLSGNTSGLIGDSETGLTIQVFDDNSPLIGIPFISEIHYDNGGTDVNEFIEITAGAGTDLSLYQLVAYDQDGAQDDIVTLSGIIPDEGAGCGAIAFTLSDLSSQFFENGPEEGRALVEIATGEVLTFISYEGTITATDGPAMGVTSTDILVLEDAGTTDSQSLQFTDVGWVGPVAASPGVVNDDLTSCLVPTCLGEATFDEPDCCPAPVDECGSCTYTLCLYDEMGNGWDGARIMLTLNEELPVQEYKLAPSDGTFRCYELEITDGGFIDIMYMNGANEIEHSYQLLDPLGNPIIQEGLLFTGVPPTPGVETRTKAECPACCEEEDEYIIAITTGFNAEFISWELSDGQGDRIAFANAGAYQGLGPNIVLTENVILEGCNEYNFTTFSANNTGWNGATWQIISSDPTRGTRIVGGPFNGLYLIASGPEPNGFGDEAIANFTLPCHFECAEDQTILADNVANCELTTFTPATIEPFICYPNICHGIGVQVDVCLPTAIGGSVTGPQGTTSAALPVGINPVIHKAIYTDGQIVRCTSYVYVVGEQNPDLTCNDNVIISLAAPDFADDNLSGALDDDLGECIIFVTPDMVLENAGPCSNEYVVTVFDENGNSLGSTVGPDQVGQTLQYSVQQIGIIGNLCWGTLTVEDKLDPTIVCTEYTIACNHPNALDELYTHTENFQPDPATLPANIAGGDATTPSETFVVIPNIGCAPLGEIIYDVNISIELDHNDLEDLEIQLLAPNGILLTLMNYRTCNDLGTTGINATFDSGASIDVEAACSPLIPGISGSVAPFDDLSIFNGLPYQDIEGDWTLIIRDNDDPFIDGVGFGEVIAVDLEIEVGFPFPYAVVDCTLEGVELISEMISESFCDQSIWNGATVDRIWQATDGYGNSSTCLQTVNLRAPTMHDIEKPGDILLECGEVPNDPELIDPSISGGPSFDCFELFESEHHNLCDISYVYEDQVLPACGNSYKILRTWTINNWCSGENSTHEQLIKVEDSTGPEINTENITSSANDYGCETGDVFLTGAITDNCSGVASIKVTYVEGGGVYNQSGTLIIIDVTNGEPIPSLPFGSSQIEVAALDNCGNESIKLVNVNITDTAPPIAICDDELHVSLGGDGEAWLYAEDIDEGSYDNCSDVTIEARRVGGCLGSTFWSESVRFACCDVNNLVTVELRVTDASGNSNICWKEVLIEDALPPVLTCPEDKTINCDDDAIHDPFGEASGEDNCSISITHQDGGELDQCQAGTLIRTFTATDGSDKSPDMTCTQRITVNHVSDFVVQFPADVTLTDCALQDSGEPTITDDDCELLAISSDTTIFEIVDDACYKMEITWTVVNWCIYTQGAPATDLGFPLPVPRTYRDDDGFFQYVQTIKVLDNDAPEIDCPGDQTFCDLTDGCEGFADLTIFAQDACSTDPASLSYVYKIDAFNDGTFDIESTGADASGVYPYGTHRIKWIVEDGCGNTSSCVYLFTIEDCKNPTPLCINGVSIPAMNNSGCVEIWANDLLDKAWDNCTPDDFVEASVKIRREGAITPIQDALTLCCDDLGTVIVEIWVSDDADGNGIPYTSGDNADFCSTYIILQDNSDVCEGGPIGSVANIAGEIETEEGEMVEEVMVELSGGLSNAIPTGSSGNYAFPNLAMFTDYIVTPEKDINPLNGVTTFDLVLITKHILGTDNLDSPYKIIAADINNDGKVTTSDVIEGRRLILFIITNFSNNTSWRFVDTDYVFPNPLDPWAETFPEVIDIELLDENELAADFIGVKIGDVNDNAEANNLMGAEERNAVGDLVLKVQDQQIHKGSIHTVDFYAKDFNQIAGYQFTVGFDQTALSFANIVAGELPVSEANFGLSLLDEGIITSSFNTNEGNTIADDAILFSLQFEVNSSVQLKDALTINSRYVQAEAYNTDLELMDVSLIFEDENGIAVNAEKFELYQNRPNPFSSSTVIGFDLPSASSVRLQIFDMSGRTLKVIEVDGVRGYNEVTVNGTDVESTGVFYYQLDTPTHSATKKMIILK